jgi:ribonuclease P protein component
LKEFGLSNKERIKSKKEFQFVFNEGNTLVSNSRKLKAIFYIYSSELPNCKVAFGVHKKAGNAVWRNRVKRLLREAYRTNKKIILERLKDKTVLIVFSLNKINKTNYPNISLNNIRDDVLDLLVKISRQV